MQMQKLADVMLNAAATVLGRLVEHTVPSSGSKRNDHEGSIHTDGDSLVTLAELPALNAQIVVRFSNDEIGRVVNMMIGGADDAAEMGAMQLSIVSETVSQIAVAMTEALAKEMGASADGIKADLCKDATLLPPPPFESYEGTVHVSADIAPQIVIDFAAITLSKLQSVEAAPAAAPAPAPEPVAAAAAPKKAASQAVAAGANAQSVSFAAMTPTPIKTPHPGHANLDLVHDIPLQISAVLGQTALPLRDVVSLSAGSVFELDKNSTDPIDLYVNNILIARGEVVVVDDKFAVKISELNPNVQ